MAFEHNFSVGKPDNLVYITELLDLLEERLEKMVSDEIIQHIPHKMLNYNFFVIDSQFIIVIYNRYVSIVKKCSKVERSLRNT